MYKRRNHLWGLGLICGYCLGTGFWRTLWRQRVRCIALIRMWWNKNINSYFKFRMWHNRMICRKIQTFISFGSFSHYLFVKWLCHLVSHKATAVACFANYYKKVFSMNNRRGIEPFNMLLCIHEMNAAVQRWQRRSGIWSMWPAFCRICKKRWTI